MKFTALVLTITITTVSAISTGEGSTVTPRIGSDRSCTPKYAMAPAAMIWPASLVSQSSSRTSSIAPTRVTITAPRTIPRISVPPAPVPQGVRSSRMMQCR